MGGAVRARELSHDRHVTAEAAAAIARAGFWRAVTEDELRGRARDANAAITLANINLVETDRPYLFDWCDIRDRWLALSRSVHRASSG